MKYQEHNLKHVCKCENGEHIFSPITGEDSLREAGIKLETAKLGEAIMRDQMIDDEIKQMKVDNYQKERVLMDLYNHENI